MIQSIPSLRGTFFFSPFSSSEDKLISSSNEDKSLVCTELTDVTDIRPNEISDSASLTSVKKKVKHTKIKQEELLQDVNEIDLRTF